MTVVADSDTAGTEPPALAVRDIVKHYGATHALRGVSFELRAGRVYGLIGVNGSGKSTLMKVLAGAERATSGEMRLHGEQYRPRNVAHAGRLGIGMVPQELPVVPYISVADNMFIGRWPSRLGVLRRAGARHAAARALGAFGASFDVGAPAGTLKLGEQQLVVIARTLHREPRLVLLDEPTSALSGAEVGRLRRVVRDIAEQGRTVLIVSQRLDDVFSVCDEIMVLRNGELISSAPVAQLTSDRAIELMLHGRALTAASPVPGGAATTMPEQDPDDVPTALALGAFAVTGHTEPIDLRLHRGEVVGLAGLPGSGPSELLRALFGALPATARECRLFGAAYRARRPSAAVSRGVAYVTGDRQVEGLVPDASVATNIAMVRNRHSRGGPRRLARAHRAAVTQISALQIRPGDADIPVRALSGGNQQKVVFARWMLAGPKLWLLDDATRGVDIGARHDIHAAVRARAREDGAAALVVSSDLLELFELCDRIVVFRAGRVVAELRPAETTPDAVEALATGAVVTGP